jgi:hypothetical protein
MLWVFMHNLKLLLFEYLCFNFSLISLHQFILIFVIGNQWLVYRLEGLIFVLVEVYFLRMWVDFILEIMLNWLYIIRFWWRYWWIFWLILNLICFRVEWMPFWLDKWFTFSLINRVRCMMNLNCLSLIWLGKLMCIFWK